MPMRSPAMWPASHWGLPPLRPPAVAPGRSSLTHRSIPRNAGVSPARSSSNSTGLTPDCTTVRAVPPHLSRVRRKRPAHDRAARRGLAAITEAARRQLRHAAPRRTIASRSPCRTGRVTGDADGLPGVWGSTLRRSGRRWRPGHVSTINSHNIAHGRTRSSSCSCRRPMSAQTVTLSPEVRKYVTVDAPVVRHSTRADHRWHRPRRPAPTRRS